MAGSLTTYGRTPLDRLSVASLPAFSSWSMKDVTMSKMMIAIIAKLTQARESAAQIKAAMIIVIITIATEAALQTNQHIAIK